MSAARRPERALYVRWTLPRSVSDQEAWRFGGTPSERMAAMSTTELGVQLRLLKAGDGDLQGVVPTPRLLEGMESEWRDRPFHDRIQAEAALDRAFGKASDAMQ